MEEEPLPQPRAVLPKDETEEKKQPHFLSEFLRVITGGKPRATLKDEFTELLDELDSDARIISPEERALFTNLFSLGEMTLADVSVPRPDIIALPESASREELADMLTESEHTRIPVYKDSLDDITGFIHSKDVVKCLLKGEEVDIQALKRPIMYNPDSAKLIDVLMRMRAERTHMCVVLDEYSATDGLVTMEDIIEQIVGEIRDEHDDETQAEEQLWMECHDGGYHISARVPLEELEKKTGVTVTSEEEEYDTVGGLLAHLAGRVPEPGETISHPEGLIFTVTEADPRRIKKVKVRVGAA